MVLSIHAGSPSAAMAKPAGDICKNADVPTSATPAPAPTTCWCCWRWAGPAGTTAADELGINHTTIVPPHHRTRTVTRRPAAGARRRWLGAHRARSRGAVGRRGGGVRRPLADRVGRSQNAGGRRADVGDRRLQRLHRRTRRRPRATAAPERRGRDRRRDATRHPAAFRTRHRSGRRRTAGTPRRGASAGRLPVGSVRLARIPRRARRAVEAARNWPSTHSSTSSTRCSRSTT